MQQTLFWRSTFFIVGLCFIFFSSLVLFQCYSRMQCVAHFPLFDAGTTSEKNKKAPENLYGFKLRFNSKRLGNVGKALVPAKHDIIRKGPFGDLLDICSAWGTHSERGKKLSRTRGTGTKTRPRRQRLTWLFPFLAELRLTSSSSPIGEEAKHDTTWQGRSNVVG